MLGSKLAKAGPSLSRSVSSAVAPASIPILTVKKAKSKTPEPITPTLEETRDPWSSLFDTVSSSVPANALYQSKWSRKSAKTQLSSNFFDSAAKGGARRAYSTSAGDASGSKSPGSPSASSSSSSSSIFAPGTSPWDHVFHDIAASPPPLAPFSRHARAPPSARPRRRQTMTKSELSAFDEMFDMIFSALNDSPSASPSRSPTIGLSTSRMHRRSLAQDPADASTQALDRAREEMELCDSDHVLLQYAQRILRPPYPPHGPHLLAHLLHLFAAKFRHPHLALAAFAYARDAAPETYVALCTAPAYAELITIQWEHFRDLGAVRRALEEMRANAVDVDGKVRRVVYGIRRDLGQGGKDWAIVDGKICGTGPREREVWDVVEKCERLVGSSGNLGALDEWKSGEGVEDRDWKFGYGDEEEEGFGAVPA